MAWQGSSPKASGSSQGVWRAAWGFPQGAAHFPPPGQGSQAANILWLVTLHTPAKPSEGVNLLGMRFHQSLTNDNSYAEYKQILWKA